MRGEPQPPSGQVDDALADLAERQQREDDEHEPAPSVGRRHQPEALAQAKPRRPDQEAVSEDDERHEGKVRRGADQHARVRSIRAEGRREIEDGERDRPEGAAPDQHADTGASPPGRREDDDADPVEGSPPPHHPREQDEPDGDEDRLDRHGRAHAGQQSVGAVGLRRRRRRQKLLVAQTRREADREPVPEPARLERVRQRRVGVSAGLALDLFSEIGRADQSRERRQRVGTALPLLRPTSHAVQSMGFPLEDGQVQIHRRIE